MPTLSPNPKNRLYTNFNSYLEFLGYVLGGRSQRDTKNIEIFEKALCERFDTQYAVCVYQCRVGIYLAVKALIKPGQEVILSPYTIADVINMVIFAGGSPVFADVDRETCNISADEVERLITPNTGAVLITHLHGVAAEAHRIKNICDRFNIPMIEDCAQSFGVYEQGKPVGTIGDVGIFSFEMHKNIPTWLGGAVITDRKDVVEKIRAELKSFSNPPLPGITRKVKKGLMHDLAFTPVIFQLITYPIVRYSYLNNIESVNKMTRRQPQESEPAAELPDIYKSYYTPFQARLGLSQLKKVDQHIKIRIENGLLYYEGLKDIVELILPPVRTDGSITYLWFPVQYSNRDDLLAFMFRQGRDVAAGHFTSNADAPQFEEFHRDCPNAKKVEEELFYLPTYPWYSRSEIEKTIQVIRQYFAYRSQQKPKKQEAMISR
ncbi:DegT/DnrJ/EryC1/StrS family aminotransferase [Nostoc sp. FACHB-152]|uniref:DegT/DnrJ/EryC1/StrS family aminotransferase n=1 Tax=unclassified Nostoc TaxID=2593658 RepID=UPI001685016C|nr:MULTISPECIES: DegT/DnrJ/EryC1/StrS family aminotransferase [unclassified Nostoc]MBD2445790.1 DegT/DnrJ/EryC1/StrS family aminotransferase [Nostoc sp. FACHB-152]MBD2466904.1 DegT/DnrJ/EryC1/StrS family aminotransferase [Nostoc sp. FACHB-145]